MKYLKKIDFAGQSVIWLVLIVGSLSILTSDKRGDIWVLGLICQFGMGCWQMVSSIIVLIAKADSLRLRKIHFLSALVDSALLSVFAGLENSMKTTVTTVIVLGTGIVLPWALAIFYYCITWRWLFPKRYTGKFLSHINF